MVPSKLKEAYRVYVYSSPIPVLSKEETIILNTIMTFLLSVVLFIFVNFAKSITARLIEFVYYFLTGKYVPTTLLINSVVSKGLISEIKSGAMEVALFGNTTSL